MPKTKADLNLAACERSLSYRFRDRALLSLALTHRSFVHESAGPIGPDNERLEFLGDSVLGLVIAELAFRRAPSLTEGEMTEFKSNIVNRKALARRAIESRLGQFIKLGKGQMRADHPADTILSCGIEAIIGAIYLDGGLTAATRFIRHRIWSARIQKTKAAAPFINYKEQLQKLFLKRYQMLPRYDCLSQSGPAHKRRFCMAVRHKGKILARGEGLSKKEASQHCARLALKKIRSRSH